VSIGTEKLQLSCKLSFYFWILCLSCLLAAGCGAPGEPVPPAPPIPSAINDLKVVQAGDGAELNFTLPRRAVSGESLNEVPAIEILRSHGNANPKSFRVVGQIPGALTQNFVSSGRVQYFDPLPPAETEAHPEIPFFYRVRTRVSRKFTSADSNTAPLLMLPVAERITKLEANVAETAVELRWPMPTRSSGGNAIPGPITFAIYRGELDPASAQAAASDISRAVWKGPFQQIGKSDSNIIRDTGFEFGKTYGYTVRTVTMNGNVPVESADSVAAIVTPEDVFPPAAPQNVVAAVVPGARAGTTSVELSWSIGVETDLAGYRVYRSEEQGVRGALLTSELLMTPAYQDNSVAINHHYWYTMTAVDHFNNESLPSVVSVEVTAPSL